VSPASRARRNNCFLEEALPIWFAGPKGTEGEGNSHDRSAVIGSYHFGIEVSRKEVRGGWNYPPKRQVNRSIRSAPVPPLTLMMLMPESACLLMPKRKDARIRAMQYHNPVASCWPLTCFTTEIRRHAVRYQGFSAPAPPPSHVGQSGSLMRSS
jgi:hypothetical protein